MRNFKFASDSKLAFLLPGMNRATKPRSDQKAIVVSSAARNVSSSVLTTIMSFLQLPIELTRFTSVCRNWRSLTQSQLDVVWRRAYLRDWEAEWEAESASDDCIAKEGEQTPWKARYRRRAAVEKNWRSGNGVVKKAF